MNREDGSARSFRARVKKTFDAASGCYGFFDFFSREVFAEVAERLPGAIPMRPGARVLEVFCATGSFSRVLVASGWSVTGVDISPGMINRAARDSRGLPIGFLVADAADLPFPDGLFDLVVAGRGLHGMPRSVRDAVVSEIRRVCAGHALFMEPKRPRGPFGRAVMGIVERLEGGYEDYLEFVSSDFAAYLTGLGFIPRDLLVIDNQHVLLCRKARPGPGQAPG